MAEELGEARPFGMSPGLRLYQRDALVHGRVEHLPEQLHDVASIG